MPDDYVFPGFRKPTFTQVPDEVQDELMPRLSGSEFKLGPGKTRLGSNPNSPDPRLPVSDLSR